jgi:hypothetical protein
MATVKEILADRNEGGKRKRKPRGSVKNTDRLAAFRKDGGRGSASWANCNCDLLHAVVVGITAHGGAVTLGLSRDLGAHSLTLLLDNQRATLWFNGDADLNEKLQEVLETISEL